MARVKDRLRPLYRHLGDGNVSSALQLGESLVKELEEEISAKRKQITVIRDILAPHKDAVTADGLTPAERGEQVRQAALALIDKGYEIVTTDDILEYLRDEHEITLDVKRPGSVVGTVLKKMKELERIDTGRFRPVDRMAASDSGPQVSQQQQ